MTRRPDTGNWRLYVATAPGRVADWPEYDWPASHYSLPTMGERDKALKRLGYRRPPGNTAWDWQETESANHRVQLFASIEVTPDD